MPWQAKDATKKTKKATSPKAKKQWAAIANSEKARGADDATAIKAANGVIKKSARKKRLKDVPL